MGTRDPITSRKVVGHCFRRWVHPPDLHIMREVSQNHPILHARYVKFEVHRDAYRRPYVIRKAHERTKILKYFIASPTWANRRSLRGRAKSPLLFPSSLKLRGRGKKVMEKK